MDAFFEKRLSAGFSVLSNIFLICLKLFAGFISGSVSVLSEAFHSMGDLVASCLAFFSVLKSSQPADFDHPFGHEKYEDMAGFIEALLIIATSLYIYFLVYNKIKSGNYTEINADIGIWVMSFSIVLNIFVSRYLFKISKKTDSIALYSDAQHLLADVYTSFAILLGLFAVKFTGIHILDPIFATIVATMIFLTGIRISKQALNNLLDCTLPPCDIATISHILEHFKDRGLTEVKSLKTKKSGAKRTIQLVLYLNGDLTLKIVHLVCDEIERELKSNLQNADVIIHAEPR